MGTRLFLCEKPSVAKDIAHVMFGKGAKNKGIHYEQGNDVITYAVGHIMEMAMPAEYDETLSSFSNLDALPVIPDKWKMKVSPKYDKHFKAMAALIRKADEVVIATDAGREGELIGREILEYCQFRKKLSRLWLQAMDTTSIKQGLQNIMPGEKKFGLYMAGLARQRADWLVGMNLSRIYSAAYGGKGGIEGVVSVGRIQTPTLALVVKRDREIENFKVKTFYSLVATFQHTNGAIKAGYLFPDAHRDAEGHCVDQSFLKAIAQKVSNQDGKVIEAGTEPKKVVPPLPYDLSSLQQEASKRLKISVSQVLDIAQALYEKHKITTYPRADCRYMEENQFPEVPGVFESLLAMDPKLANVLPKLDPKRKGRAWSSAKVAEADHHAIMPKRPDGQFDLSVLNSKERVVYEMIRDRFLMQFAPDYEYDATTILIECEHERFQVTGNAVKYLGWKGIFNVDDDEDDKKGKKEESAQKLPKVEAGDSVREIGSEVNTSKTAPPKPYTDGALLGAMESVASTVSDPQMKKALSNSKGLGTSATRAAVIDRLLEIKAVEKQGTKVISTTKGRAMIDKLPDVVTNPETTALWELFLEQIEKGSKTMTYEIFMEQQCEMVKKLVANGKVEAANRKQISV